MLSPGQQIELEIEKPAAGGRMIARHEGQVVLVRGAIPGERVLARVDKADRQLAFASTVEIRRPSPDRREPFVDPLCGGCLFAHVEYARQPILKADIIRDAFARLGRIALPSFDVAPSPEHGYRMRGRLYVRDGAIGFFREGTHALCDAAATCLLTQAAVARAAACAQALLSDGCGVDSVVVTEDLPGDSRALHVEVRGAARVDGARLEELVAALALAGCSVRSDGGRLAAGDPSVSDPLDALTHGRASQGRLRRRAESFFQANRFLLPALVSAVMDAVPSTGPVIDLYAGVGLFAVSLAALGRSGIVAVEGEPSSGADLAENASQFPGAVRVFTESVERFLADVARPPAGTLIVDPPRTGISRAAMSSVSSYGARRIVYVSCDPATMARDARRLVDAGYSLETFQAFDLFPNTPHVESVGVFDHV